ncbi:unnamed protein product [Rotaria socialis]
MADIGFLSLPTELHYRIFDYADAQTILISVRRTCKRLKELADDYDRFQLCFSWQLAMTIKSLVRVIRSENINAITLSDKLQKNTINVFFSLFDKHHFTRLSSLTLVGIHDCELA